jgi:hypothetical protein
VTRACSLDIPVNFNLPVIALVVIVILNDATIISIAYDHVKPSTLPERWNLPVLFIVAIWIGLVACFSSLLLLRWALDSEDPTSPIRQFCSESLSYGQVRSLDLDLDLDLSLDLGLDLGALGHTRSACACLPAVSSPRRPISIPSLSHLYPISSPSHLISGRRDALPQDLPL